MRHRPKVCVFAAESSQPGVLELTSSPQLAELFPFAWKRIFSQYRYRSRIENGEPVKCNGCDFANRVFAPDAFTAEAQAWRSKDLRLMRERSD